MGNAKGYGSMLSLITLGKQLAEEEWSLTARQMIYRSAAIRDMAVREEKRNKSDQSEKDGRKDECIESTDCGVSP